MKKTIQIKTSFHYGIASIGGKTLTYYTYKIGPRNLMRAITDLHEHSESMEHGYGNVGHQGSWIEIAGVRILPDDLAQYEFETDPSNYRDDYHMRATSKTVWLQDLIERCLDGRIVKERKELSEYMRREDTKRDAEFIAEHDSQW